MPRFTLEGSRLIYQYDAEKLWIEGWGKNALRIRGTKQANMPLEDWALIEPEKTEAIIEINHESAIVQNGTIRAIINVHGKLEIFKTDGTKILEEYVRNLKDTTSEDCSALEIEAREFRPILGGDYELTMRLASLDPEEKIYGMGQYQQPYLNLKGCELELAQRNSQASIPFALSSLGYGFLWNNPAIGRVTFGKNITTWHATATKVLDYWVCAGENPSDIMHCYSEVTGKVPMMPDFAMGFWQCKLRYQSQEELLSVAREYKRRNLPISVIVVDYFHWPRQGDWKFDKTYWPDPDGMITELKSMNIELMVSVWPTVDPRSENYEEMEAEGYLIRTERGVRVGLDFEGQTINYDATNPDARKYVWNKAKKNYYDKGIRIFWLDEAEPECTYYDFDNYRYYLGPNVQVGNIYPVHYAKTFYDGMKAEGQKDIINLVRCGWAGSQRYGALIWSGDIASSFKSLRNQFAAGLNMGLSGIPWWTTDIGGFHGGNPMDKRFRELLIRWFQYGTFCPVMRLHGDREPKQPQIGTTGGATCLSGADNEVWSFGEDAYGILKKYMVLREEIKPYIKKLMREAHEKGSPVIRPLFYDFPDDSKSWKIEDQYMFGPDYLIAPVLYEDMRQREVYLPLDATWKDFWTGDEFEGGRTLQVDTPIEKIPVFIRLTESDGSRRL